MKTNSNLKILDCTLRDGGYYNNWEFDENIYSEYLKILTKQKNINCIEIGFRLYNKSNFKGAFAFSSDNFLKYKKIPTFNYAVMINASDLIKSKGDLIKDFVEKKNSSINIIRIAAHFNEINFIKKYLIKFSKLGYKIFLNIMQINLVEKKKVIKKLQELNNFKIDVIYFADSLGNLKPREVKEYCNIFRKYWNKDFGFHAHDNRGYALKNCIEAKKSGAKWLDGTIQGMGRGAGNVTTEDLLSKVIKLKKRELLNFNKISKKFKFLKQIYKWGKCPLYEFAATKNIHPTYVQNLKNQQLNKNVQKKILINISKLKDAKNFSFENFNKILTSTKKNLPTKGKDLKNFLKNKNVLIIANSSSLNRYGKDLPYFIKKNNCKVLSLNVNEFVSKKLIDYCVISHYERYIVLKNVISKNFSKKFIIPKNIFSSDLTKNLFNHSINYNLIIKEKKFDARSNYCILPNNLSFTYAMALCKIGAANKIFLAGFDGHNDDIEKFSEMENTIKILKRKFNNNKIISITPSRYSITKKSLYAN